MSLQAAGAESAPAPALLRERLPALDGVRGIAILLVLLLHFSSVALANTTSSIVGTFKAWGWMGVDLFFALSGFLITSILLDTKGSANYFRSFYARRLVRILPAYYLLLGLLLLLLPRLWPDLNRMMLPGIYGPAWTYWTHTSNLYFALHAFADGPLGHTWSLAIEEQFYLVWPAVVLLFGRRQLLGLCLAIVIGVPLLRAALLAQHAPPLTVYFLTVTRLDGLVMGGIVALFLQSGMSRARLMQLARWAAPAGALLLCAAVAAKKLLGDPGMILLEASKYSCISLSCAALVALAVTVSESSMLSRLLRSRVLTFLGRYSYGLYLFHLPVISLIGVRLHARHPVWGDWLAFLLYLVLTVGLSLLSWHAMEKHFLKLKRKFVAA